MILSDVIISLMVLVADTRDPDMITSPEKVTTLDNVSKEIISDVPSVNENEFAKDPGTTILLFAFVKDRLLAMNEEFDVLVVLVNVENVAEDGTDDPMIVPSIVPADMFALPTIKTLLDVEES